MAASVEVPRRPNEVTIERIVAPTLARAHEELGVRVGSAARRAIAARLAKTPTDLFVRQIEGTRASQSYMERTAADPRVAAIVRGALRELIECVEAWGKGAKLDPGKRRDVSVSDLALWAQDDNAGCQTGVIRQRGGSVIAWHTEEDTIGYLDRPRVAAFSVGSEEWCAFLYPYLLPGPAFGWRPGQFHAVDSLYTRRVHPFSGTLSGAASWLIWRIGPAMPAGEVLRAVAPFVDGCAIHVASCTPHGVSVSCHEIAGNIVKSRRLAARAGSSSVQVNAVSETRGPLAREEEMSRRLRGLYERRLARMQDGVDRLTGRASRFSPGDVLEMIASRRGGTYAYANADVKAHAIAEISRDGLAVHVGRGPARAGDVYAPAWRSPSRGSSS